MTPVAAKQDLRADAALALAAAGTAIFPCRGKLPAISKLEGGKGFKDATNCEATIVAWWIKYKNANIGMPTGGINQVFVLDIDGPEAEAALAALEAQHGKLPSTRTVRTRPGRRQLYFRQPRDTTVRCTVSKLAPKLDVRGDGGYVMVPPSIHPHTRKPYIFLDDREPAEPPPWLIELVCDVTTAKPEAERENTIPEGTRNGSLASLGGVMRRVNFSHDAILAALLKTNQEKCKPPLPESEVRRIAESISRYSPGLDPSKSTPFRKDLANSAKFAAQHAGKVLYVADKEIWYADDGKLWVENAIGTVMRYARQTVLSLYDEARQITESDKARIDAMKWAIESEGRIHKIVTDAQSELALEVRNYAETFDLDPLLLNCENGTYSFKEKRLLPHDASRHLSKITRIRYDEAATCPRTEAWLLEACGGSQALADYLWRLAGYVLTGLGGAQSFWIFHGPTKTGKSTFIKLLRRLAGTYGTSLPEAAVTINRFSNQDYAMAELAGVRLATLVEIAEGKRFDEGKIKQITGQDYIKACKKWQNYFEFMSQAKLVIALNHKPDVRETGDAFWSRTKCVPFNVYRPPEKRIEEFENILIEKEGPGILAKAIRHYHDLESSGWQEPEEVTTAVKQYREEQDVVRNFISEFCVEALGQKILFSILYAKFRALQLGAGERPMTKTAFGIELDRLGYSSARIGNDRARRGLALKRGTAEEGTNDYEM